MAENAAAGQRHSLLEDAQALIGATLMIALGVNLYRAAGLLTGGTAGMAFLAQYGLQVSFGVAFFVINLPFYWLAVRRMGWSFTLRTLVAVSLLSLFAELTPHWVRFEALAAPYASVVGGILMGVGMLMLFRHRASLGGVNIAVLYLQERFGWRAGHLQMGVDSLVVLAALFIVEPQSILLSVLGAVVLNLVLALNHRPGRYSGIS